MDTFQITFPERLWLVVIVAIIGAYAFRHFGGGKSKFFAFRWIGDSPRRVRLLCLFVGILFMGVALARPRWGVESKSNVYSGREIYFALDLSRSMMVDDVAPSRLERAKLLLLEMLDVTKGDRVGLVLFAGTAYVQCPLSADDEVLRDLLHEVRSEDLPQAGTDYYQMLKSVREGFGSGLGERLLVVLSDGESLSGDWEPLAKTMEQEGVRVLCIGVGTRQGGVIPDGKGGLIKEPSGAVVVSKLESGTLEKMVSLMKGRYVESSGWVQIDEYLKSVSSADKSKLEREESGVRLSERYQWPLCFALLLGCWSLWRELPTAPSKKRVKSILFILLFLPASWLFSAENTNKDVEAALLESIARIANQKSPAARDYSEIAEKTLQCGRQKEGREMISEGVIDDALKAVQEGERINPKEADWNKLRQELEALKQKKQEQQKKSENKSDSQKEDKQDNSQSEKGDSKNSSEQNGQEDKKEKSENSNSSTEDSKDKKKGESSEESQTADSDNKKVSSPSQSETRQVGGGKKKETEGTPQEIMDARALEQVKSQDSPAKLFQTLEGKKRDKNVKEGKTW